MSRIRLAMNASPLLMRHTGIASYTRELALALRHDGQVDPMFFYGVGWSAEVREESIPGAESIRAAVVKVIPLPYLLKRLGVRQRRFDAGVRKHHFDVYHEPNFLPLRFDGPIVITVHDLSPLRYPETHPADRVRDFRQYLPNAIDKAARIIVDSEFVGREVIEMFRVDPARVRPIHLGVSDDFRPREKSETAHCLAKYGLEHGRYALAVGTLEPRKNLARVIEAHAALPEGARKRAPLAVTGAKGWLTDSLEAKIAAAEQRGDLRWFGYVPPHDLPLLYAGARFLVYPSIYEGFGLPVLEAMASGTAVITSNQASLPEVAGEAAIIVDALDGQALRDAMLNLIDDDDRMRRLESLGLVQAARFTWRACAERTVQVYREAIEAVGSSR